MTAGSSGLLQPVPTENPSAWRALWSKVHADAHPIDRPWLCPHLRVALPAADHVILFSDDRKFSLHSLLYAELIPLLVAGQLTRAELNDATRSRFAAGDVDIALRRLTERGFLVAYVDTMARPEAGFWTALGISPLAAQTALQAFPVAVDTPEGADCLSFRESFRRLGGSFAASPSQAAVRWIFCDSYLDPGIRQINAACLASGQPWGLARLSGLRPMIGPLFRREAACWHCLAHRLRGNLEVESYLYGSTAAHSTKAALPPGENILAEPVARLAAQQLARALVINKGGINDGLLSFNVLTGESSFHPLSRLESCPLCGKRRLPPPASIIATTAFPSPSTSPGIFTSGGYRSLAPTETLERYRHLSDPLLGIVSQLLPVATADEDWNHTYVATHRFSPENMDFAQLRHGLRSKSSGKGSSRQQAMASAFGEAIERYSGIYQGNEASTRCRFHDFAAGDALPPNDVMGFSEQQYARRDITNRLGKRAPFHIPEPFDPDRVRDWSAAWSLTENKQIFVPTELSYYYAPIAGPTDCLADSNGAAAGNTIDEAIVQGFLELVERDAYALWWYNRLSLASVPLEAFEDPYLARAERHYAKYARKIWLLDATTDSEVTVFIAVSRRTDKAVEDVILGAGAHFDPRIAALRAVTEMNQHLFAVAHVDRDGRGYLETHAERLAWWRNVSVERCSWLLPASLAREQPRAHDGRHDSKRCLEAASAMAVNVLVVDQTRPEVGMPAVKVMAPGLRHFWPRFAAGRLYDVPVRLGRLVRPLRESELTDLDVFV